MSIQLIQSDARNLPLPDNSIQCCVTSPPYWGLRDYGVEGQLGLEPTPEAYVTNLVAVFREVRRVLRDDGTVWLNLGDGYACGPCTGTNGWKYGSIGAYSDNGRGAPVNKVTSGLKPKDLVGIPWRVALALQADGWWLRSDIIWHKPNPMPESVTDRPTKSHEYMFLLTKAARYYYDHEAVKEAAVKGAAGSRFDIGKTGGRDGGDRAQQGYRDSNGRNRRTVWTIPTQPYKGAHFATFPEALVEPCILAGSRESDTVLDPFCGSGTVGVVCKRHNRNFIGIDLNPDYLALASARINPL